MVDPRAVWRWIAEYARADDPLSAVCNTLALVVVGNQPFYPLYVWWFVGDDGYVSFLTFLSTPFFAAVPALTRRWSTAGRALLPLAGIANTFMCARIFGAASGVEAFYAPCLVISALCFRGGEKAWMLATIGAGLLAFTVSRAMTAAPLHDFTAAQYAGFVSMNTWSVAMLTILAAYKFGVARQSLEHDGR